MDAASGLRVHMVSAKPQSELKDHLQFHAGSFSTIPFGMAHRADVVLYKLFLVKRGFEKTAVIHPQKIIVIPPFFCMTTNETAPGKTICSG